MFLFSTLMFYSNEKEQIKIKGFFGIMSALYSFKVLNATVNQSVFFVYEDTLVVIDVFEC